MVINNEDETFYIFFSVSPRMLYHYVSQYSSSPPLSVMYCVTGKKSGDSKVYTVCIPRATAALFCVCVCVCVCVLAHVIKSILVYTQVLVF